jgi:hypothetical protein
MRGDIRAAERLYFNADRDRVLRKGEPGTHSLFKAQGQEISQEEIERFQLDPSTGIPMESLTGPEKRLEAEVKAPEIVGPKAPKVPEENKMDKPDEAKTIMFGGGVRERESNEDDVQHRTFDEGYSKSESEQPAKTKKAR